MKKQQVFKQDEGNSPFSGVYYNLSLMACFYLSFLLGTEFVAFKFGLHVFYQPYMVIVWAVLALIHNTQDGVFIEGVWITMISIVLSFLATHIIFLCLRRRKKETEIHGSAKWGTPEDFKNAKLLNQDNDEAVYIGSVLNEKTNVIEFLRDLSTSHILVTGSTGSGKGTGSILPNLLSYKNSVVVTDIKGENFLLTSGYRRNELKQNIFVFNPASVDKVIAKSELIEIGIDWQNFVYKLIESKFAVQIDQDRIVLKEDFGVMKDHLERMFPEFMKNEQFVSVIKRPKLGPSSRWNPLKEIPIGRNEVKETQNIVEIIYDPDRNATNNHWVLASKTLVTLSILHILYAGKNKTMAGVVDFLSDPDKNIIDILNVILKTEHDPSGKYGWKDAKGLPTKINPSIASLVGEMKKKEYPELSGVISTALSYLTVFRDPIVAEHTSDSDFMISDIIRGERPSTVYAIFPPSDIQRIAPLVKIFINLLCSRLMENSNLNQNHSNTEKTISFIDNCMAYVKKIFGFNDKQDELGLEVEPINGPRKKHKVLLILDEFPALGRLESLRIAISYMRGYGLRAMLIVQSIEQLTKLYKDDDLVGHCDIKIVYSANSEQTAKVVSGWAGVTTLTENPLSYSMTQADHISVGTTLIKRALILPDEILHMDKEVCLIFANGINIYGRKIVYFKNKWFLENSQIPPAHISDKLPTKNDFWNITDVVEYVEPKIVLVNGKATIQGMSGPASTKIAKSKILEIGTNGPQILNELIKGGIVDEISPTEIRINGDLDRNENAVRIITKESFVKLWSILKQSPMIVKELQERADKHNEERLVKSLPEDIKEGKLL